MVAIQDENNKSMLPVIPDPSGTTSLADEIYRLQEEQMRIARKSMGPGSPEEKAALLTQQKGIAARIKEIQEKASMGGDGPVSAPPPTPAPAPPVPPPIEPEPVITQIRATAAETVASMPEKVSTVAKPPPFSRPQVEALPNVAKFHHLEGKAPKTLEELQVRIASLWEAGFADTEMWEVEFESVRMLKAWPWESESAALDWVDENLSDCLTVDSAEANWFRVKSPCWRFEMIFNSVGSGWDHPDLKVHRSSSGTRKIAGAAFMLQQEKPTESFRLDQLTIAELMGCSQPNVCKAIDLLCERGWLVKEARGKNLKAQNYYRCPVAFDDGLGK